MLLGITGTNGAGKGTVVEYLVERKGFAHFSVREFLIAEIQKRGLPIDRTNMRLVADELRATHRPSYIIEELYKQALQKGGDAIIESIRARGEAEFLKKNGVLLVTVDADRAIRYERIVTRASETDKVDYDTWVEQEEAEWHNTAAHEMDIPGVIAMADIHIENNGSLEELHAQIEQALA